MNDRASPADPDTGPEPAVREDTGGWISGSCTGGPETDPRLLRAREVLEGCPPSPYSPAISPAEKAFWCERAVSALRDCVDLIAEHDAFPAWRADRPRLDGSVPAAGDKRVTAARELLAGKLEPLTMTPGDLRSLLARHQRVVAGLVNVIDGTAP